MSNCVELLHPTLHQHYYFKKNPAVETFVDFPQCNRPHQHSCLHSAAGQLKATLPTDSTFPCLGVPSGGVSGGVW